MIPTKLSIAASSAFLGAVLSGCFFVQPINDQPEARIEVVTPGPHYRGAPIVFSAAKSRDDDSLQMTWTARACNRERNRCDTAPFETSAGVSQATPFEIVVPGYWQDATTVTETVVIRLVALDAMGAEHEDQLFVDALNQAPELSVQRLGAQADSGGYPVGLRVDVTARAADPEGDVVTFDWQFPGQPNCPGGGDCEWKGPVRQAYDGYVEENYFLVPQSEGSFTASITAVDSVGGASEDTVEVVVQPDQAPCIQTTLPQFQPNSAQVAYIFDRDSGPRRFSVLRVSDELDVYPPPPADDPYRGRVGFRWFVRTPDTGAAFVEVRDHDVAHYLLHPDLYAPGDVLAVRVEIVDRVSRTACDAAEPLCSLRQGCYQRVTWEGEVR